MGEFRYKARTSAAELVDGRMDAESLAAAARNLIGRGLHPTEIVPVSEDGGISGDARFVRWGRRATRRLGAGELALFARQLADLCDSGMTLDTALGTLVRGAQGGRLGSVLRRVQRSIREGSSLAQALAEQGDIFPATTVAAIRAGEASGNLVQVLGDIAHMMERQDEFYRRVRDAVAYPMFVLCVGALTMALLTVVVIPRVATLYQDMDQALPLPTRLLLATSGIARSYGIVAVLLAAPATTWAVSRLRRSRRMQQDLGARLLRAPIVARTLMQLDMIPFAQTLATLLEGGVPAVDAIRLSASVCRNAHVATAMHQVALRVREGLPFGHALQAYPELHGPLTAMIVTGEVSGELAGALRRGSLIYERELDATLKRFTTMLEPVLILLLGLAVGLVVLAMMLPVLQLNLSPR